jgi:hypothetical protein
MAWTTAGDILVLAGASKIPHPSMQAYSAPEWLKPSRRIVRPSPFTILLPWTFKPVIAGVVPRPLR